MPFLYFLSCPDEDLELAQAELWAMTGCEANGRIGLSPIACDITRGAYVAVCGEAIAQAPTLEELCARVAGLGVETEDFRIDVRKRHPKPKVSGLQIATDVADVIAGYPDLDNPKERFLVWCAEGDWRFVRVLSMYDKRFTAQADRPHNLSQALSARHARAFVNLVAAPGDLMLDACAGSGTCLLEANIMGIRAVGTDIQPANAFITADNLKYYEFPRRVAVMDSRDVKGRFDAVVIDFPYGHTTTVTDTLYEEILNNVAPKALRIAVILGRPGDELFASLGLEVLRCARVKASNLVRHFYVLRGGAA